MLQSKGLKPTFVKIQNGEIVPAKFYQKKEPKKVKPGYKKKRLEEINKKIKKAKKEHINEIYRKKAQKERRTKWK